jgi:ABC-2 type transport system ATP-binding protein
MRGHKHRDLRAELVARFQLDPRSKIRKMSKGTRQKLAVVAAFMHDPQIYVLDEPTAGLDPLLRQVFVDVVREEKARGKTFLISSHLFEEIARTCDRAGIIREGKLVAVEDIQSLTAAQRKTFLVSVKSRDDVDKLVSSGLTIENIRGNNVEVTVTTDYQLFTATLAKCRVTGIDVVSSALEQAFMKYYSGVKS